PPPPPPPPPPETAPPPKLQVRVPAPVPVQIPVPPLPVPPTPKEDRIASTIPPGRITGPVTVPLPPPPPRPPEISNVTWQRQPAPEFPERAISRGIEAGTVQLVCTVSPNGSATNCSIVSEDPSGAGFGQAAVRSMSRARFSPRTVDGVAEGGRARFTIRFRLAD
ncbi:MAG: energy transducer TonB, partial [Brevundimonas sp.]